MVWTPTMASHLGSSRVCLCVCAGWSLPYLDDQTLALVWGPGGCDRLPKLPRRMHHTKTAGSEARFQLIVYLCLSIPKHSGLGRTKFVVARVAVTHGFLPGLLSNEDRKGEIFASLLQVFPLSYVRATGKEGRAISDSKRSSENQCRNLNVQMRSAIRIHRVNSSGGYLARGHPRLSTQMPVRL
jgi:hypothetical protein